jgi:uncharacterized damage-inducible protein DinB
LNLRPEKSEYNSYYVPYVNLVREGDIVAILSESADDTIKLLNAITENQGLYTYGPGKWSIKEVIGHITDTERIMNYRILCIARGEEASLPGFDENSYVQMANFNSQSVQELLENYSAVRHATIQLLKGLDNNAWVRKGTANHSEVTVRAIAYIIAGHELHHRQVIVERYINSDSFPMD